MTVAQFNRSPRTRASRDHGGTADAGFCLLTPGSGIAWIAGQDRKMNREANLHEASHSCAGSSCHDTGEMSLGDLSSRRHAGTSFPPETEPVHVS